MRIIKAGKKRYTVYRITCRHCGCVFECDETEGKTTLLPRNESVFEVKCPECKTLHGAEL